MNEDALGLSDAHRHSAAHRDEIHASTLCGCFYCCAMFAPDAIREWIDRPDDALPPQTALCPRCGIDSVIGSASGFPITGDFLSRMRARYFGAL
jgi:hypothetical protein